MAAQQAKLLGVASLFVIRQAHMLLLAQQRHQ
ncbi:hypothetical protein FOQG_07354 [Fusarium oxysporum f. sp. raphani 54005]|uniref:Uncharacterized protein n=6 Tax=Fusarium oxysporum TaxID=5507 RepID=X0CGA9_FUSOX|nr:hypothetical protein FOXG_17857 [Fusarium oxysporum f. sp. lycopersici 4287]EXA53298.1 hypothetical protein FOVG_01192 [Fusarium oxysporum f. sp. pisi HDV247]EXK47735.1 hypothetical protein FOMG_00997 [Fusarium oxysporum f. sp. melonis 26406]EXK89869.1 hypothetical protein FOQG_07354 [Fusarium oxysporum f. sp. raphani 54005]EXL83517.1 hypothetical protein FOPG_03664 [Fusarium oxysporum f. sp. conglutinans race 2 54008]EXM28215.1 hypothetical protein FOTG_05605 [Fusarium oxysporum f. sp. vas